MSILRDSSWVAGESPTSRSSAVKIPSAGIFSSCRETRFSEAERSRGNVGKTVSCKRTTRSRGAELPRKLSGKTNVPLPSVAVLCDFSRRYSNDGNDSSNNKAHFSKRELVTSMSISHTRAGFFSISEMLSSSSADRDLYHMMTGRAEGQKSGVSRIGFLFVETIRKSRRRGYPNTTNLHLLHTCASLYHFHGPDQSEASRWYVNISRRTSSGSD